MTSFITLPVCGVPLHDVTHHVCGILWHDVPHLAACLWCTSCACQSSHLSSWTWVTWNYFLVTLLLAYVIRLEIPSCTLSQRLDLLPFPGFMTLQLCGYVKHAWDLLSCWSAAWIRKWVSSVATALVGAERSVSILFCCECDFGPLHLNCMFLFQWYFQKCHFITCSDLFLFGSSCRNGWKQWTFPYRTESS